MTEAEFAAGLLRDGYVLGASQIAANEHRDAHAHGFDVRLLVTEGVLTLVFGEERRSFGPGDTCAVAAGIVHEEHGGPEGARYVVGRRSPIAASAAA